MFYLLPYFDNIYFAVAYFEFKKKFDTYGKHHMLPCNLKFGHSSDNLDLRP